VDDVEEGGEAVDVVELARERGGEVEAEAVDVAWSGVECSAASPRSGDRRGWPS
jgi:hypothetical protein